MEETPKRSWTDSSIQSLVGESESARLEFKAGALFDQKSESRWVEDLSIEVSAFANTEGGDMILGVREEKRGKSRVAAAIDGIEVGLIECERLQRLIEGNVSPYLPGIRVHQLRVSGQPDRVVFVIHVPQGSTAYQAKDHRYYGRSEFEAKPLPDHEIRLRMNRGKVAQAVIEFRVGDVRPGSVREAWDTNLSQKASRTHRSDEDEEQSKIAEVMPDEGRLVLDEIQLFCDLRNNGELTVRDPMIELIGIPSPKLGKNAVKCGLSAVSPSRHYMHRATIYPGDIRQFPGPPYYLSCSRELRLGPEDYRVRWKIFIDNSPASEGGMDIGVLIQKARENNSACVHARAHEG